MAQEPLDRLRDAIETLVQENLGDLDDWEQEIVDSFNALPGVTPITFTEDEEEEDEDD